MTLPRLLFAVLSLVLLLTQSAAAEKRVALVIGNSAYANAPALANPVNDAADMARALTRVGFEVVLGLDLDKAHLDEKIRDFARKVEGADVALLFYAGHGLQVAGQNYLVPVDARLGRERDLDFETVNADFIIRQMELDRDAKTNIVFLDACRDNPLMRNLARSMGTRSASLARGLAPLDTGVGTFIAYSTQPGNVALDGEERNSPFTAALVRHLAEPSTDLAAVMIGVRKDVLKQTGGRQVPWDHSALTGAFYFNPAAAGSAAAVPDATVQERIRLLEEELRQRDDPQRTAKMVELAEARTRVKSLEEANQADQQQIFDLQMDTARPAETTSRDNPAMAVGKVQMRMVRRNQEIKTLRARIAALETDLGIAEAAHAGGK